VLRYLTQAAELVLDLSQTGFGIAVVICLSVDRDTIELAFLDLLPEIGVEIFALQDLDPCSHLGIGEVLPVTGLEDVVLDYGELRHRLHVVIDITLAHQSMFGEVIAGLLNLLSGVVVALRVVDVGLHQGDEQPSLGSLRFTLELGGVDLVLKASAGSILDHKALLIGGSHLIEKKRDQLDFHIAEFSLSQYLVLGSDDIHCTSLKVNLWS